MSAAEDIVVLPEDNGTLPADTLAAIQASDAYPETTGYKTTVEFIDFERHGKPFNDTPLGAPQPYHLAHAMAQ